MLLSEHLFFPNLAYFTDETSACTDNTGCDVVEAKFENILQCGVKVSALQLLQILQGESVGVGVEVVPAPSHLQELVRQVGVLGSRAGKDVGPEVAQLLALALTRVQESGHKLLEARVEGAQVDEGSGPRQVDEPQGGPGHRVGPGVPVVDQARRDDGQVVLVTVLAVVLLGQGTYFPVAKERPDRLGAVYAFPVLNKMSLVLVEVWLQVTLVSILPRLTCR